MPVDPHAQRLLRILAASYPTDPRLMTIEQRRDGFRGLMGFCRAPAPACEKHDRYIPGGEQTIALRIYTPAGVGVAPLPGLMFFHGGGLVAGTLDTHDSLCHALAHGIGCRLISVGYRLAPEHKFPAAMEDCYQATTWAMAHADELGLDPRRIGIAGDSAGGTLAVLVCQKLRDACERVAAYQLLLCPIMNYVAETESRILYARDLLVSEALMTHDLGLCLPERMRSEDPRISPLRATDMSNLPTAFIHTAEFDPLRDEGLIYAQKLTASGVTSHHTCHPGMTHLFYARDRISPYATTALNGVCEQIRSFLN
jgi:acetyl esterase/lipase